MASVVSLLSLHESELSRRLQIWGLVCWAAVLTHKGIFGFAFGDLTFEYHKYLCEPKECDSSRVAFPNAGHICRLMQWSLCIKKGSLSDNTR